MDDLLRSKLREEGKQCAKRGGHYRENPFIYSGESGKFIVWHRGFLSARITDPECRECHGSGTIILPSMPPGGKYDNMPIECTCNKKRSS